MKTTITHGTTLTRQSEGPVDELGTPTFWNEPIDQMYARHPFKDYQTGRCLTVWHMDHRELDRMTAARIPNNQDYDVHTPGCQAANGLQWPDPPESKGIEMGAFPNPWQADYTGPYRSIPESEKRSCRRAYVHEEGHRYFWKSRCWKMDDDISKLSTRCFRDLRPHQAAGDNEYEDAAEVFRAIMGSNETVGYFSDGKPFQPSPELRALVRCLWWLSVALRGCWVASLIPQADWVWFQVHTGWAWEWRRVSAEDWRVEKWNGSTWVRM